MRKRTRVAATVRPGGAERVPVLAAAPASRRREHGEAGLTDTHRAFSPALAYDIEPAVCV